MLVLRGDEAPWDLSVPLALSCTVQRPLMGDHCPIPLSHSLLQVIGDAAEVTPCSCVSVPVCSAGGRESRGSLDHFPQEKPLAQTMPVRCQGCESRAWAW